MAERGMPNPAHVVMEKQFVPRAGEAGLAAAAAPITILVTDEVDEYEEGRLEADAGLFAAAAAGDNFDGKSRRASKLSLPNAPLETFDDLKELIDSLPDDQDMADHVPPINAEDPKSRRVAEEKRNVRVDAFLYAASREDDNDFHLILGRDPDAEDEELYMTAEISGLPPANSASFAKLNAARNAYKSFFPQLPGAKYHFYRPPVAVRIEGALFWDAKHVTGGRPGPQDLRPNMPTIWEIHPVSKITFEV